MFVLPDELLAAFLRFEDEELDRQIRVRVNLTHLGDHLAAERQPTLEDADHRVIDRVRLCLGRALPVEAAMQGDHAPRHLRELGPEPRLSVGHAARLPP